MSIFKFCKDFPTFVKRFRKEREWTQKDLADQMGVHAQYVSNVERAVNKSYIGFGALLLPLVERERKPFLLDLIGEASSQKAVVRLQSKARVLRKVK
jgi:transcriptional regulator with XRE-family HTH domain